MLIKMHEHTQSCIAPSITSLRHDYDRDEQRERERETRWMLTQLVRLPNGD